MSKNESKLSAKLPRGRPMSKHGGYSFLTHGTMPENRSYILRYLSRVRQGLIEDIGGTEEAMSTGLLILIDRIISKLGCVRVMEEFVRERGVMKGDELQPCLRKNYLAFSNSLRRDLESMKEMAKDQIDPAPSIQEIIQEFEEKKERESSE